MYIHAFGHPVFKFVVGFFDALRLVCFVFFVAFSSTLGSILVAFGLLFGTFLSTLGVPGQSRGAFGHPWAPKAQKVRKRSQKTPKVSPQFEHFSALFAKKRCFFKFVFPTRFLIDFWSPRDHPEPVKTSKTIVVLYENKVSKKSKKRAPELHFGSILELFLRSLADFSDFFSIFGVGKKTMKKRTPEESPRWPLERVKWLEAF